MQGAAGEALVYRGIGLFREPEERGESEAQRVVGQEMVIDHIQEYPAVKAGAGAEDIAGGAGGGMMIGVIVERAV